MTVNLEEIGRLARAGTGGWERERCIGGDAIADLARQGLWGAAAPAEFGGAALPRSALIALAKRIGAESASLLSVFTVHCMLVHLLDQFGGDGQKEAHLRRLASGEMLGAFAITEADSGSDPASGTTEIVLQNGAGRMCGQKHWISSAQYAGLFAVLTRREHNLDMVLVERATPGLGITTCELDCFRAAGLGTLAFYDVLVREEQYLLPRGAGVSLLGTSALNLGRLLIAAGATGAIQACGEIALAHAGHHTRFGEPLYRRDLIKKLVTELRVGYSAADALCAKMGRDADADPDATYSLLIAKYFASKALGSAAANLGQILGARSYREDSAVARLRRDAAVFEIIEGPTQLLELLLGNPFHAIT